MCTLIILRDVISDCPLVLAANRDEFYDRPTASPQWLCDTPSVFAGQDLLAGGTWLGVRRDGYVAALTNQPSLDSGPAERSRGQLVLALLEQPDTDSAARWLQSQPMTAYLPFNVLFGTAEDLRLAYGRESLEWAHIPKGLSVLTNGPLNAPQFPKVERIQSQGRTLPKDMDDTLERLKYMLSDRWCPHPEEIETVVDHRWPPEIQARLHAVNVETEVYGTRSSAIIALGNDRVHRYLYCDASIRPAGFNHLLPELQDLKTAGEDVIA